MGELEVAGPSSLADLDGWSTDDLLGWLDEHAPTLAIMEDRTDRAREAVGLALYQLRVALDDGAYGIEVGRLATLARVSARTLRRWREAAEEAHQLPPADNRSLGRREQLSRGVGALASPASDATSAPAKAPRATKPERVAPDKVLPPPPLNPRPPKPVRPAQHEQPTLPGGEAWGRVLSLTVLELVEMPREERRSMMRRLAEADRLDRRSDSRRSAPSSVAAVGCPHPKPMWKQVGFGTICDPQAGGCGAKVS